MNKTIQKQKTNYIVVKNLRKSYDDGRIRALRGANLTISKGEFVAIMGPSGCGKSTLMNMIGALDKPDQGRVEIEGEPISGYSQKRLSAFRARKIGYIFQLHNLIPTLNSLENIQVPMLGVLGGRGVRQKRAFKLLSEVGLVKRGRSLPTKLSGGERQRVAVARALANDPKIIIADEPTGALDSKSAKEILALLKKIHRTQKSTIIMVTHNLKVAKIAGRIIKMKDGKVE